MFGKQKKQSKRHEGVSLITYSDKTSPISEQYRTIRTNIQYASIDKELQTFVVTSSGAGEGKSTTAANLAVVFADTGKRTLLVDADLRKPSIAESFILDGHTGLSNLIANPAAGVENYVQQSSIPNLAILSSGIIPPNPSELLASQRMNQVIEELKQYYEVIIFDMPPIALVTDAQIMASKVDGTILVIREGQTDKESVRHAKQLLERVQANILGVVFNAITKMDKSTYYYYAYGVDK